MQRVKVSRRFQIAVPSEVRRKLGIRAGDTLTVDVEGNEVRLRRDPESWAKQTFGLHKEVWDGIDPDEYLHSERAAWRA